MAQPVTAGRICITIGNLAYSIGAFIADWNETHVKNPLWPPHARFHNGQTMSLGVCLATTSLYFLYRPAASKEQIKDHLFSSALVGTWYCLAALSAIFYPGTDWQDPEHMSEPYGAQGYLFAVIVALMWIGYTLESRRLNSLKAD